MLRKILYHLVQKSEQKMGRQFDYMRDIIRASPFQFLKFSKIFAIADQRTDLPLDLYHIARIIGAMSEDCGTCVQLEVDLAKQAGFTAEQLRDIVNQQTDCLTEEQIMIVEFARMLAFDKMDNIEVREYILKKYGQKALVDFAFSLNAAKFLPSIKRTMGHAISCQKIEYNLS